MKKYGMIATSVSAMLYGSMPLMTSLMFQQGMNAVSVSFFRYAIMIPILLIACLVKKVSLRIENEMHG